MASPDDAKDRPIRTPEELDALLREMQEAEPETADKDNEAYPCQVCHVLIHSDDEHKLHSDWHFYRNGHMELIVKWDPPPRTLQGRLLGAMDKVVYQLGRIADVLEYWQESGLPVPPAEIIYPPEIDVDHLAAATADEIARRKKYGEEMRAKESADKKLSKQLAKPKSLKEPTP